MRPIFAVIAEGEDITTLLQDRLLEIQVTDKTGLESDELTITLDDRDGAITWPAVGKELEISLGYEHTGLTVIGKFKVDELESRGMPQSLTLRGCPSDLAGTLKQVRKYAWDNVPLSQIVSDIAGRNKLKPVCDVKATVKRADQVNESDIHFLTRLANTYDATCTIKGGSLLVLPKGGQVKNASGKKLDDIVIKRADIATWTYTESHRNKSGGAVTKSHDRRTGKTVTTEVKDPESPDLPMKVNRHPQASPGKAGAKANATLKSGNRSTVMFSFTCTGRVDILAERKVKVEGIKVGIDGTYPVESVVHTLTRAGWVTSVQLGNSNDARKGAASKKTAKKKSKKSKKASPGLTTVINNGTITVVDK